MSPQQRRESVRVAVLQWLAERGLNAFDLAVIVQRLNRAGLLDFNAEPDEVTDALAFLRGSGFVSMTPHPAGATPFYQVTSAGVLANERGTLHPRPL